MAKALIRLAICLMIFSALGSIITLGSNVTWYSMLGYGILSTVLSLYISFRD